MNPQSTTMGPGGYPMPFAQVQQAPPPPATGIVDFCKFVADVGRMMVHN